LIYLNALAESDLAPNEQSQQPGVSHVAEAMRDAHTLHTVIALQESSCLRSRLRYLLASLAAHGPDEQLLQGAELRGILNFLAAHDQQLSSRLFEVLDGPESPKTAIVTSARIGGDLYRAPQITVGWKEDSAALALFNQVLGPDKSLGDNEDVILASPAITINSGLAPSNSSSTDRRRMQLAQEFMNINLNIPTELEKAAWRLKNPNSPYKEEDLAVFMAVRPSSAGPWSVHPLPADIRLRQSRALIRLNAWGLLDHLLSDRTGTIQLFIAGWKPR
jgi:hypothetical protein